MEVEDSIIVEQHKNSRKKIFDQIGLVIRPVVEKYIGGLRKMGIHRVIVCYATIVIQHG